MKKAYIGVDVGSGSVRAGVFSGEGKRLGLAVRPIQQFRPKADYVEQSSNDIWEQTCIVVREAVKESGLEAASIRAIGFDATCSLVALDKKGAPASVSPTGVNEQNVIMWMDHRAIAEAELINATHDDVLNYVGGKISPEMEMPKILWLKRNQPNLYGNISLFLDLADFMVWRASGNVVRSVCTVVCKWTYLAHESRWSESFFKAVGLEDLPASGKIAGPIQDLGTAAGNLSAQAAEELGLLPSTMVATGIIDAHAGGVAIIGSEPEKTLAIIGGTSSCHMAVSKKPIFVDGVWGPYWGAMLPGYWLAEGGQSAAGSLIDYTIANTAAYPKLVEQAKAEKRTVYEILNECIIRMESEEGYLTRNVHLLGYHHGNRSPRAAPHLRGMVSGLTLNEGVEDAARLYLAAVQSVAYGTRHIIEAMNSSGYGINRIHMCGGGTKNPLWLREHADICGCDIVLPEESEAVILGAAMLAASASGDFASLDDVIGKMPTEGRRITPRRETAEFHAAKYAVFKEMYKDQMKYRATMAPWIKPAHS